MVRGVHGALVGGARGGPAVGLAGGARHVPGVPRALLPAGRVPGRHFRAHRRLARRPRPARRRVAAAAAVAAPAPAALPRAPPPPLLPPSQRLSGASIFLQVLVFDFGILGVPFSFDRSSRRSPGPSQDIDRSIRISCLLD